jgi:hypothetical protein
LEQEMQTRSPTKKKSRAAAAATPAPVRGHEAVLQETSNSNIATNPFLASLRARDRDRDSEATIKANCSVGEDDMQRVVSEISPKKLSLRSSSVTRGMVEEREQAPQAPATAVKKQRKLTTRKWDLGDPEGF